MSKTRNEYEEAFESLMYYYKIKPDLYDNAQSIEDEIRKRDDRIRGNTQTRLTDQFLKIVTSVHFDSRLFKKARGKDLDRDREVTAKVIVDTKEEYLKKGSSKVDLEGYDTKQNWKKPTKDEQK